MSKKNQPRIFPQHAEQMALTDEMSRLLIQQYDIHDSSLDEQLAAVKQLPQTMETSAQALDATLRAVVKSMREQEETHL